MQHLSGLLVIGIEEGFLGNLLFYISWIREDLQINCQLAEYHLVSGESARLVCEEELHLPHLFDEIAVPAYSETASLLLVDRHIMGDKVRLTQLDYFKHHIQRNGYHV